MCECVCVSDWMRMNDEWLCNHQDVRWLEDHQNRSERKRLEAMTLSIDSSRSLFFSINNHPLYFLDFFFKISIVWNWDWSWKLHSHSHQLNYFHLESHSFFERTKISFYFLYETHQTTIDRKLLKTKQKFLRQKMKVEFKKNSNKF